MLNADSLEFRFVEVTREGAVAIVRLNDPPANTLTYHLVQQLEAAFLEFSLDPRLRAVVITGAGERFFCGGVNIGMLSSVSRHYNSNFLLYAGEVFSLIDRANLLVVAAINGHVTGGGLEVGLIADRRVAVEGTYNFGFPEVRLGVIPGLGGTQRLARLVGTRLALELITHGDFISVNEARDFGIVDAVLPREGFLSRALDYARQELSRSLDRPIRALASEPQWHHVGAPLAEYQRRDRIGVITLSEQCRGVSALQVLWALNQAFLTARLDEKIEAILIVHDGSELELGNDPALDEPVREFAEYVFRRIENTPRLCALAFQGALGPLATELAFACDFRLATANENRGSVLFSVAPDSRRKKRFFPAHISRPEDVTVAHADRHDLFKRIDSHSWPGAALTWMSRFVSPRGASKAMGYAKLAIIKGSTFPEEAGRMLEWHLQEQLFRGHDGPEGMRAYLEKRTAVFKGE
jgi:enoyl-CoA hydratase